MGNYCGWKATCIGNNSSAAVSQLKQEYKEGEMSLNDALDLSVKVINSMVNFIKYHIYLSSIQSGSEQDA